MLQVFDQWLRELGAAGYALLGLAAFVEYVFPPFPGDSILVLGGVYAVRGERSWVLVFAATLVGSLLGAAVDYGFGRLIANHLERRKPGPLPFGLSLERLHGLQAKMRERGALLLVLNRFLPGARALVFVAAGGSRMTMGKVLALGAVSAVAWNALLFMAGVAVGGNAERIEEVVRAYQRYAWGTLALVCLLFLARWRWSKRQGAKA